MAEAMNFVPYGQKPRLNQILLCIFKAQWLYPLEMNPPAKQSMTVSRTFGKPVGKLEELYEAISSYTVRASEKIREQKLSANSMTVFINTNRFNNDSYPSLIPFIINNCAQCMGNGKSNGA